MDTPWDSMVISNLCSVWRRGEGDSSVMGVDSPASLAGGMRVREGSHLKVVQELFECHLLAVRLQPLDLKAIPQRPLLVIVLRDKEQG